MSGGDRSRRLLVLVVAAGAVLAACGGSKGPETAGSGGASAKTVNIGFVGALTGDNANLGKNIRRGMQLAVDEANAEGGGPTIAIKDFDTAGTPEQATTVKDRFIGDKSIVGIVGPAFSAETKALIPALQEAGLVMISPSATNVALPTVTPNATVFHRVIADDALQASGVATYLATVEKPKGAAFIHDNSEYGKGLTEDLQRQAAAKGIRAVLTETVDPKAQDFSATVNKVKASRADVVFYGGYYAEAGRLKKQLTDAGATARFVSGDGSLDPGFITAAGTAAAEGARLTCPCNLAFETSMGRLKDFYTKFKTKIGQEPGLYSPEAYDAATILAQGIRAGNVDRPRLLRYVEEGVGTFQGVSKTVEFAENGNIKSTEFFVFQVKAGKIAPLETVQAAPAAGTSTTTTGGSTSSTTG